MPGLTSCNRRISNTRAPAHRAGALFCPQRSSPWINHTSPESTESPQPRCPTGSPHAHDAHGRRTFGMTHPVSGGGSPHARDTRSLLPGRIAPRPRLTPNQQALPHRLCLRCGSASCPLPVGSGQPGRARMLPSGLGSRLRPARSCLTRLPGAPVAPCRPARPWRHSESPWECPVRRRFSPPRRSEASFRRCPAPWRLRRPRRRG